MTTLKNLLCFGIIILSNFAALAPVSATPSGYPPDYVFHYNKGNPLFNLRDVEVKPKPIRVEAAKMTPELIALHKKAQVTVEFVITTTGTTENLIILGTTDKRFNECALTAVKAWKYSPPQKGGRAVNCRVQTTLSFE